MSQYLLCRESQVCMLNGPPFAPDDVIKWTLCSFDVMLVPVSMQFDHSYILNHTQT